MPSKPEKMDFSGKCPRHRESGDIKSLTGVSTEDWTKHPTQGFISLIFLAQFSKIATMAWNSDEVSHATTNSSTSTSVPITHSAAFTMSPTTMLLNQNVRTDQWYDTIRILRCQRETFEELGYKQRTKGIFRWQQWDIWRSTEVCEARILYRPGKQQTSQWKSYRRLNRPVYFWVILKPRTTKSSIVGNVSIY